MSVDELDSVGAPQKQYEASVRLALEEFKTEGASGLEWYYGIGDDFEAYVNELNLRPCIETATMVPETGFWAIFDGQFAGRISIRHKLNEKFNLASIKIIERWGGVLARYYWISLKNAAARAKNVTGT